MHPFRLFEFTRMTKLKAILLKNLLRHEYKQSLLSIQVCLFCLAFRFSAEAKPSFALNGCD